MVVYLKDDIDKAGEEALSRIFQQDDDISQVQYISNEEALEEVRDALGSNALILDDFQENPLPSSFELKLKNAMLTPAIVREKAAKIGKMPGVEEVQYGEKWLSSLYVISKTMKIGAICFGFAMLIAITFITYCTMKIFFHRKNDEIETMKLLGATRAFTRLPFLIEGIFIGTMGGIISSIAIFGAYSFATLKIIEFLPSIGLMVSSIPMPAYFLIPFAGATMSFLGSFIAVGKIRY
jgi:cell division transport system permease protein